MICLEVNIIYFLQVPLGVLNKSEMKHDDMIAIMEHLHQYVPTETKTIKVNLSHIGDKMSGRILSHPLSRSMDYSFALKTGMQDYIRSKFCCISAHYFF